MGVTISDPALAEAVVALRAAGCVFAEEEAAVLGEAASDDTELFAMVRRRATGEPLEQVVGYADFCGVRVRLRPGVFVPRVRSELLVRLGAEAAARRAWSGADGRACAAAADDTEGRDRDPDGGARPVVVDLCCGSGALGKAVAMRVSESIVYASDSDPAAVACARDNLGERVYQGDLYEALPGDLRGQVDVLLANVPYVATRHIPLLPSEARQHEPQSALDGGRDGLDVFRRVVAGAPEWLAPCGIVLSEITEAQADTATGVVMGAGLIAEVVHDDDLEATVIIGRRGDVPRQGFCDKVGARQRRGRSVALLRRFARARLASRVLRRLRRAGVRDARYDARAFAVRFTPNGQDVPTVMELGGLLADLSGGRHERRARTDTGHQRQRRARTDTGDRRERRARTDTGDQRGWTDAGKRRERRARIDAGARWGRGIAWIGGRGRRERGARIDRFVAGFLRTPGVPADWSTARPLLRPVLRAGTPMSPDVTAPLRRPALPFLPEYAVIDQPDTMTYVSADQLAGWGVTADEVFAAARANLSGAVLQGVATEPTVVQFMDDGDAYWTSHLLVDGWLARLADQVGGAPVAFAPERGTLIVAADGIPRLPDLFAQAERVYTAAPYAITPMAYVSDEHGHTIPYAAPDGHPMHECVRRAEGVLAVTEYARQAATLDRAAELRLVGSESEGWRTRAVWASDEAVLLPRADEVQVGGAVHPWTEIEPHLTPAPDLDPPRWHAPAWPR